MRLSDFIISRVHAHGVDDVFFLPGGGCMHLVDALARTQDVRGIPLLHEQSVAIAADAYAQVREDLGVALVTTGPGGTNAITGLVSSWLDSTPVLVISGQVKTSDLERHGARQHGFQEVDICALVEPVTKRAVRVRDAQGFANEFDELLDLAKNGRPGPVWVDIPLDLQEAEITPPNETLQKPHHPVDDLDLSELLADLRAARAPLILLGNGVRSARAVPLARSLIEEYSLPAVLTWKAIDFLPFDHPLNHGRPGILSTRSANLALQSCDFLLAIGARLDMGQTAYQVGRVAPHARRWSVDIDASELAKYKGFFRGIEVDAGVFLQRLSDLLSDGDKGSLGSEYWGALLSEWRVRYALQKTTSKSYHMSTYEVLNCVSDLMPPDAVFAPGSSGACSEVSMQAIKNRRGQRVFNSEGLGAMGFGVPAAIGAAIAKPGAPVFSIDGDGGFVMNMQDLAVAVDRRLPICWIVLCNEGYGSIRVSQDEYFNGRRLGCDLASGLALPRIAEVAEALGAHVSVVSSAPALVDAVDQFGRLNCPTVVCASVDPNERFGPRVQSFRDADGAMRSAPLESMSPVLDRSDQNRLDQECNKLFELVAQERLK